MTTKYYYVGVMFSLLSILFPIVCLADNIVEDTIDIRNGRLFLLRTSMDQGLMRKSYIVRKMNTNKGREVLSFEETDALALKINRFLDDKKTVKMIQEIEFLLVKKVFKKGKMQIGNQLPFVEIRINADGSINQVGIILDIESVLPQKKVFKVLSQIIDGYMFDNYKTFELLDKYKYLDNEGCAFTSRIKYDR